ncbi:hypothetical protein [Amorphus sp. 3PC139-8]
MRQPAAFAASVGGHRVTIDPFDNETFGGTGNGGSPVAETFRF